MYIILIPSLTGHKSITADLGRFVIAVDSTITHQVADKEEASSQTATKASDVLQASGAQSVPASPTPTAVPNSRITVRLAGSISLNQDALKAMGSDEDVLQPLFEDLSGVMKADLGIATLENTVIAEQKISGQNMPQALLSSIAQTGINTLCIGFDGILNSGMDGMNATRQAVREAGMVPFGVYASQEERMQQTFLTVNGQKVALLHFQDYLDSAAKKKTNAQEREFAILPISMETMESEIVAARQSGAGLIIVSLCWGKTGAEQPTDEQREIAQQLADAGADLIVGTHSQTVQTVEILQGNRTDGLSHPVLCAYSLGNLCTANREKRYALAGMILNVSLEIDAKTGQISFLNTSYLPTYSWRGKENGVMRYRVLRNDGINFASYVDSKQQSIMQDCFQMVDRVMKETPISYIYQ